MPQLDLHGYRHCVLTAVLALLCAGCLSGPPPRFYTLDMRPSGRAQAPVNLEFDRLRPAEALDREGILIQTSPTRIEYYAADQWAANLGELVTQKLEAEFAHENDAERTLVVTGTILDFGQVDLPNGAEAHVRLALEFREPGASRYDPPLLDKTYEARISAESPSPAAVVEALSRGLEDIAVAVATDLERR